MRISCGAKALRLWLGLGMIAFGYSANAQASCEGQGYLVGAARSDITGPVAEVGMMGYADLKQIDEGLHMRLWSRALVISDACRQQTAALVIGDIGQVFGGLKEAVVKALEVELPGVFTRDNVLFSATHTHSGPGGFAHHALYNITTFGFSPLNFDTIVKGTVDSIARAYRQQQKGRLEIEKGELQGVQFNRSPEAYANNPEEERAHYTQNSDPEMLLLKAVDAQGQDLAAFNWFAIHGVSIPMENKLVSGDNKGLAAYLMEKQMGKGSRNPNFVAGFVQANSGDISPYALHQATPTVDQYFARNEVAARAQYEKALELYQSAHEDLVGPVQVTHKFARLPYRAVDAAFTHGAGPQTTCQAVLGVSFAAGTENGQPIGIFKENTVYGVNWKKITLMPGEQECHKEKVLLLPTGFVKPDPWTAQVAPFQLIRIGQLAVIGTPFEVTTMAGRRLKQAVLEALASEGVRYVAIAALANEYLHYVTTREEYAKQAYEGGSTLYGPWSLAAYTQIYDELARDMRAGQKPVDEGLPLDLSHKQLVLNPGVIFDAKPFGKEFGDRKTDVAASYARGSKVEAEFWGAHPNNSIGRDVTLLTVERLEAGQWFTVRTDNDPDTFYRWKRDGLANSIIRLSWNTSSELETGTYRLCHKGHSKTVKGDYTAYEGCTQSFLLE